jgi:hypothetical protein
VRERVIERDREEVERDIIVATKEVDIGFC